MGIACHGQIEAMHPSRVVFWWQSAGRKWMFGKTFPYEMNWELDWLNPSLKKHTHTHLRTGSCMNYEPGFALILIDITSQDSEEKKLKT